MIPQLKAPETFQGCQLCGHKLAYDDICAYRMWQRCDNKDNPVEDYLITCNNDACFKRIDDDPLLFIEVPWSRGGPGRFMLLCGDCPNRKDWSCLHPNLKSNGGEGLLVNFAQTFLTGIRICMSNGKSVRGQLPPANRCEGHPDKDKKPLPTAKQVFP